MGLLYLLSMLNTLKRCNNYKNIIGREDLKDKLINFVNEGRDQVFILNAPNGSDKGLWARTMAAHILCQNPNEYGACGNCNSCRYIEAGSHPDHKELSIPEKSKNIAIDTVRAEINAEIHMMPQFSDARVWIIDGNGLAEPSQNALLKELEEPPLYAYFIITIDDKVQLLPTFRSRAIEIDIPRLNAEEMDELLNQTEVVDEKSRFLAKSFSSGLADLAVDIASNAELVEQRREVFNWFFNFLNHDASVVLTEDFAFWDAYKGNIEFPLSFLSSIFRDLSLIAASSGDDNKLPKGRFLNQDYPEQLSELQAQKKYSVKTFANCISIINETENRLKFNSNFEMSINSMLLKLMSEL